MNETQRAAAAAGFLHALRDPDVLARWQDAVTDSASLRELIGSTLGLAAVPSEDDLAAMKTHAEEQLAGAHERLIAEAPDAPHAVGMGFSVQPKP